MRFSLRLPFPATGVLLALLLVLGSPPVRAVEDEPLEVTADQAEGSKESAVLTGNVRLRQGRAVLTGETGFFDKRNHHQNLRGNVRFTDGDLVLTALAADYYDDARKLFLTGGVVMSDSTGNLYANQLSYDRRSGVLLLEGQVIARDRRHSMAADRMSYNRNTRWLDAEGKVQFEDQQNKSVVRAPRVRFQRDTHRVEVPRQAELDLVDQGRTTHLSADSVSYDDGKKIAYAIGLVRMQRDSLRAEAGEAVLYREEKRAVLTGEPRARDGHGSTRGDTLVLHWDDESARRVVGFGHTSATYTSRPEKGREETAVASGAWLSLELEREEAKSITVRGQAHSEFKGLDAATGESDLNEADGDSIQVFIRGNQARLASVWGTRTGRYSYQPGKTKGKAEEVRYRAGRIDFDLDRNTVYLRDSARVEYQDLSLRADSVEYDMRKSVLHARGRPTLKDPGQEVRGLSMEYDLDHQQGTILGGRTSFANGFFTGDSIKKVSETVLNVRGGNYTTCDLEEPHYHIRSSRMKIYLHDKVVLGPTVFYVKDLPLMVLPFYVFPIKEGRHSGILFPQFDLGLSSVQGRFIRNGGYYWAINDFMDLASYVDYYQSGPQLIGHLDWRYKVRYLLDGNFATSLSRNFTTHGSQWQVQGNHQQQLGERTSLSASADFVSDAGYLTNQGLGLPVYQRVSRNLHSYLALNHNWTWGSYSVAYDRNQDLAVAATDSTSPILNKQEPNFSFSLNSRALGRANNAAGHGGRLPFLASTYFGANSRLSRQVVETRRALSDRWALGSNASISDRRRVLHFLDVGPALNLSHALLDQDALGNRYAQGLVWSGSLNASATLYGTSHLHIGPMEGFRHVFSPSISYVVSPEFKSLTYTDSTGRTASRFSSVAGIGLSATRQSRLQISVDNNFQMKVRQAGQVRLLESVARLSLFTGYDFLASERGARPWSQVNGSLLILPNSPRALNSTFTYDPYRESGYSIRQFSFSTSLDRRGVLGFSPADTTAAARTPARVADSQVGAWTLRMSYSYNGSGSQYAGVRAWSASQNLSSSMTLRMSPAWGLSYNNTYDLARGRTTSQSIQLKRDLHCWEATFTRSNLGSTSEYYFRINVKARPEIGYTSGQGGLAGALGGTGLGQLFGR